MELKPTAKVAEALALAQRAAQGAGNPEITPDHLDQRARPAARHPAGRTLLQAAGTGAAVLAQADARCVLAAHRLRRSPATRHRAAGSWPVLQQADT